MEVGDAAWEAVEVGSEEVAVSRPGVEDLLRVVVADRAVSVATAVVASGSPLVWQYRMDASALLYRLSLQKKKKWGALV